MKATEIDLFDNWEELRIEVINLLEEIGEPDSPTFSEYQWLNSQLKKLGYECEYGMDASIYGLKRINP